MPEITPTPRQATSLLDHARAARKGHGNAVIGRRAIFITWDGDRLEGVVSLPSRFSSGFLTVRFDDGSWARLDSVVEVVNR